jgi:mutator family transposase
VREDGIVESRAALLAIGNNWKGHRQVLEAELANRESASSWREFLLGLKRRGLSGVEAAVSGDHGGLRKAIAEILPEAAWQRCYVHFLLLATQGRRLPAGAALALRPAQPGRGATRPARVADALAAQAPETHRLGGGEHREHADLLAQLDEHNFDRTRSPGPGRGIEV